MIALEAAQAQVLAACARMAPMSAPLDDALGCVTSAAVVAAEAVPPFANSAMDGFAVRAADTAGAPVSLAVVGLVSAGQAPTEAVGLGQAVQIMTGAPMPPGADAVVMVEHTRAGEAGRVVVERAAKAGDHIRSAGGDIAAGQEVFGAGTVLGPGHLGVLASVGMRQVSVHRRPRVGVLSTGDELVDRPGPLALGQVRDANRPALLALCRQSGFVAVDLGRVGDRRAAVEAVLDAGGAGEAGWDALVTSGGVSMGEFDYVKAVLSERGAGGLAWVQVAIKPAKPLAFAVVGGRPVFGLPGNPVSALVSFELFARPALRQMAGFEGPARFRTVVDAVAGDDLRRRPDGKLHLVRVVASWGGDGRVHVTPSGGQSSHLLRAMALANALALLPDGDGVGAGETVQAMLLSDPR